MNKALRQLFTAVVALFVILGLSTTIITAIKADDLNADSRNTRMLYHTIGAPRGAILASDGTVLAQSDPVNDPFSYQRTYSNGPVYAPVTGYFSITHGVDRGIEASRNEQLNGQADSLFWQQLKDTFTGNQSQGASVETSIDPTLQQLAYQLLDGKEGAIIASDPKTGRILAMVSTPSYDPNALASHDGKQANAAYSDLVVAKGTTAGNGTDGKITLQDALAQSSNTAFAQLGVSLGANTIRDMAERLGYDDQILIDGSTATGSPTYAAASSFPEDPTDDRLALASIGQGDTLSTPLQNLMVAMAVANDGTLMEPTIVDRVRASDLSVISETYPHKMSEAFSADTANKLTQMMEQVIPAENPSLAIDGVSIAAKTGTAQIGESNEANDAWIIGFAPADDPQIAVSVVVHNVNDYGAHAAGPLMRAMMQEALQQ